MASFKELIERYHNRLKYKDLNPEALDTREPIDESPIESDSEKAVKNMTKQRDEGPKEEPVLKDESFPGLREFLEKRRKERNG
jgi:hypothetical protein